MIDTQNETLLPLSKLAREVPSRSGRGVQVSTVWRWCIKGCKGIKLESVVCGAMRFSSRDALHRFFAATTAAADGTAPRATTSKRRQASIEQAEKELAEAGL